MCLFLGISGPRLNAQLNPSLTVWRLGFDLVLSLFYYVCGLDIITDIIKSNCSRAILTKQVNAVWRSRM